MACPANSALFPPENPEEYQTTHNDKQLPFETDHHLLCNGIINKIVSKSSNIASTSCVFLVDQISARQQQSISGERIPADGGAANRLISKLFSHVIIEKDIITSQKPVSDYRHCNKIICRVRTPFCLINSIPSHVNHDKSKTNKHQPFTYRCQSSICAPQRRGKYLRKKTSRKVRK